jgi:sterol desaturase/sphingolipid hydroxylase (fatty acid hydroxylase superfamily)
MKTDNTGLGVLEALVGVLAALVVLAAVFFVIERLAGRGRNRVQPILRRGWLTDVVYWFTTIMLTKPFVRLMLMLPFSLLIIAGISSEEALRTGGYTGFGPLSRQPLWLQAIQVFLILDFFGYWAHRLFHRGRWWPFHAVHHSSTDLDWLGSMRVHPFNDLVNNLAQATPVLLLGYNPYVTLSAAPALVVFLMLSHANVNWDFGPLRCVIVSPVFHRWHHSREREAWDKNFANLFPVWDILFGTYYMPRGRYPDNFGINEPMPDDWLGQVFEPFVRLLKPRKKVDPPPIEAAS